MELSPETCRVKPLRRINAIVASSWNYFTIIPQLPHVCIEKIFSYLSNEDLRILIYACKPVSVSSPNTFINNVVITSDMSKIS